MQRIPHLLAVCALAASATAQFTLVTPNGYAGAEGGANNAFPWSRGTASTRIQFVTDSSHFTAQSVTYPILITQLRYRADAAAATITWAGGSWPQVRIDMATCPVDHSAVTATFASNLGADLATVYNGPVTVASGTGNGAGIPGPWYITIPVTPFVYDPNLGDLVVDIYQDGTGWTGVSRGADHVSTGTPAANGSRIYNTAAGALTAVTGTVSLSYQPVTEFTYTPATGLYSAFTANVTGGATPLAVNFTDLTFTSSPGGVTSWAWDFDGDNVVDSTLQNPTFTYTACGDYNVTLTTTDGVHPPSVFTKTAYIKTDVVTPSFTYALIGPGIVQFTDTSSPVPTSWAWDLDGDNIVDSNIQNPVFVYPSSCTAATITQTVSRLCKGPFSSSQSLVLAPLTMTTTMAGGNGLSAAGSGNTFDIQVTNPQGINLCAVSLAPYMVTPLIGTPLTCTIWVTDAAGGYLANHTNAAVWRQVATGNSMFAGGTFSAPLSHPFVLSNPVHIPFGTYGMAIHMTTGSGVAYTTLTAQTTYPGPDFNIIAGNGKGAPFNAAANNPRAFNGSFHYSTSTNGGTAGYGFLGAGCAGTLPIANQTYSSLPTLGGTLSLNVNNMPAAIGVMVIGFSNTISAFGPLPFDLALIGAPGCRLRVSLDATDTVVGVGTSASWSLPIPNSLPLLGALLYNQTAVLDPLANAFGFVMSDASAMVLGN